MSKYALICASFLMVACSSAPVEKPAETQPNPSVQASEPGPEETKDDASQVLNKNKKCPKKSRMVKGKCVMQVETTE